MFEKLPILDMIMEPLLSDFRGLSIEKIDWAIVGGESSPHSRPVNPEWVRLIREQCIISNIPFFFKQWGGFKKSQNGRLLDGRVWDEMPVQLKSIARQYL